MLGSITSYTYNPPTKSESNLQPTSSTSTGLKHWRLEVFSKFEYCYSSFAQYFISSVSYCLAPHAFLYVSCTEDKDPQLSQHFVAMIFFGLPVYFMQLFLGRYTQNSLFNLRFMVPVFRGLVYVVLLRTAMSAANCSYYMIDSLMFAFMSFQTTLPWTVCPQNITEVCYEHAKPDDCGDNCYHASYLYWKYVYMDGAVLDNQKFGMTWPVQHRFVSLVVVWILIYVITRIAYKKRHRSLATFFGIFVACMLILLIMMISNEGSTLFLPNLFEVSGAAHLSIEKWTEAYTRAIMIVKLGHGHHWLAGARLPMNAPVGLWSIYFILFLSFCAFLLGIIFYIIAGVYAFHIKTNDISLPHSHQTFFITVPGGLSYNYAPQIFSIIFYVGLFILALGNIVVRIITLQLTLTNWKPILHKYKGYLLVNYCMLIGVITCICLPEEYYYITRILFEENSRYIEVSIVALLVIVVFWVYGVQTLCDDILYLTNQKPIKFWPIVWYMVPLVAVFLAVYTLVFGLLPSDEASLSIIVTGCLHLPIVIFAIQQFLVYIQRRRLLGLLEPDIEWGVPDPEDRHLRRLFNPRTETKFQYSRLKCQHKCMHNSQFLKKVVYCEVLQRKRVM